MSETTTNKGITNICGLWTAKGGSGGVSTSLNDRTLDTLIQALQAERAKAPEARSRLMVWPNKFSKEGSKDPTHKMVLLAPRDAPAGQPSSKPDGEDFPF